MKISYHPQFVRQFKGLTADLQEEALEKIELFEKNHKNPILKTHKLHGRLKDFFAFSVNYSYRIVFDLVKKEAIFLEIGNHDIYK